MNRFKFLIILLSPVLSFLGIRCSKREKAPDSHQKLITGTTEAQKIYLSQEHPTQQDVQRYNIIPGARWHCYRPTAMFLLRENMRWERLL